MTKAMRLILALQPYFLLRSLHMDAVLNKSNIDKT